MEDEQIKRGGFSWRILPGAVALAALLVYGVTLNHWYSLKSLTPAAVALGVDWWSYKVGHPLLYLLASPFRWLPAGWQVVGLNALSAVCAAGVLALLARTVALLPQDRTQDQRLRNAHARGLLESPFDWLPPVFAVLVCGLQMSFWEHATVATGEMLYLLLFAFVVWCLAEYRIDRREGRLRLAVFAYGIGIATNWAMIGFLPVFGIALLWLKGFDFFRWRFLLTSLALLLAGMLLYLYDPMLAAWDAAEPTSFWKMLTYELATQRNPLLGYPKGRVIMLSVTSLLPLLLVAIRWPSNFGDVSGFGVALASLLFRLVHLVFLAAIAWVAFDPAFSPRALGYGLPMLTFYFLGALAAGYLTGYFLLVGGAEPVRKWRRTGVLDRLVGRLLFFVIWAGVIVVPILLIRQNLPRIRVENGDLLRRFTEQLAAPLPKDGALVLGTDSARLQLLNAWCSARPDTVLIASMRNLGDPRFHRRAAAHYADQWPDPGEIEAAEPISVSAVVQFLAGMSRAYPLWAVDGLPGTLLLESLHAEPNGMLYRLQPIGAGEEFASADRGRESLRSDLDHVRAIAESLRGDLQTAAGTAVVVGQQYSAWVNSLGVEAQTGGDLESAKWAFDAALTFNERNISAKINTDVNTRLREGKPGVSEETASLQEGLTEARSWSNLLRQHGPIDESQVRTFFGELLLGNDMRRQAMLEFDRALFLNGTNLVARLRLARVHNEIGRYTNSMALLLPMRGEGGPTPNLEQSSELDRLTALNEFRTGQVAAAEQRLKKAIERNPDFAPLRDALMSLLIETKRYSDALEVIEEQLRRNPGHRRARFNLGPVYAELGRNEEAIAALSELIAEQTNNSAILANRGSVYLKAGKAAEAEADYRRALQISFSFPLAHIGLADVALLRSDTNGALGHLETAMRLLPEESPDARALRQRLAELRGEVPTPPKRP